MPSVPPVFHAPESYSMSSCCNSHMFRVIGNILYQMLMQIKGHMAGVVSYLPVELSQNMNWHLKIACFVSLTVQTIFEF